MSSTAIDTGEVNQQSVRRRLSQDATPKSAPKLRREKTTPTISASSTSEPFKDIEWSKVAQSLLINAFKALLFFSAITMLIRGLPWLYELLPEHVELDSVIQGLWTLGMLAEAAVSNIFWALFKATGAASNCLWNLSDVGSMLLDPLVFIPLLGTLYAVILFGAGFYFNEYMTRRGWYKPDWVQVSAKPSEPPKAE